MIVIMIFRHSKLHNAGNMWKKYATYFAKLRTFSCIFCLKKFRIF